MDHDLFRRLQQRLDQYSMGFPAAESGIEIEILRRLFSEADAALFLEMSPRLETPASVADRLNRPEDETGAHLEDMSRRGLLFRMEKGGEVKYGAIPFVHGIFEFQVQDLDRELAELVDRYFEEAFHPAMQQGVEYFLRTIPVGRSVQAEHRVAAYEDAAEILKAKDAIVVTDCICRKHKNLVDQGCGKPLEACFMFGSMGRYYLDRGMGRLVELDEALQILADCQEAGLVVQPAATQNPSGMCNCCGDCCGVLAAVNRHPRPVEIVFSNHFAAVDAGECTGCETCLERCQTAAISIGENETASVNLDRCIGCGLCVESCPAGALSLQRKDEAGQRVPPETTAEQMMLMARKRGLV